MTNESVINQLVGWNEYRKYPINLTRCLLKKSQSSSRNNQFYYYYYILLISLKMMLDLRLWDLNVTISLI